MESKELMFRMVASVKQASSSVLVVASSQALAAPAPRASFAASMARAALWCLTAALALTLASARVASTHGGTHLGMDVRVDDVSLNASAGRAASSAWWHGAVEIV